MATKIVQVISKDRRSSSQQEQDIARLPFRRSLSLQTRTDRLGEWFTGHNRVSTLHLAFSGSPAEEFRLSAPKAETLLSRSSSKHPFRNTTGGVGHPAPRPGRSGGERHEDAARVLRTHAAKTGRPVIKPRGPLPPDTERLPHPFKNGVRQSLCIVQICSKSIREGLVDNDAPIVVKTLEAPRAADVTGAGSPVSRVFDRWRDGLGPPLTPEPWRPVVRQGHGAR